jgi:glycine/sarcosine N-methyltransferase
MDSLYARLAEEWDNLFPPDLERLAFLDRTAQSLAPEARITEVGCGSGATAVGLAELGSAVAASDLDADMIAVAVNTAGELLEESDFVKASHPSPGRVSFRVADMVGALESGESKSANLVLCLGNTLPHLTEAHLVARFFDAAYAHTSPGGQLIIQILNYEKVRALKSLVLRELVSGDLSFRRRQVFNERTGFVEFSTEVEMDGQVEKRRHTLNPLESGNLNEYARRSGYEPAACYEDWSNTLSSGDSPWFVLVYSR